MDDMQRAGMDGQASMRIPLLGSVQVGGKIMKELRFMPYSEFPEIGREETLYIDTDGNVLYYYDGAYIALSGSGGGGTGDYNELSNKPQINGNVLTGNKTAANLGLQETISDIDTIRSGAASGSTAVQPATLATALATKQDVIDDLNDIRTGAGLGATAIQPADMETALSDKQDVISDLDAIRSGATAGNTALQPEDIDTLPTDGSSNPVSSGGTYDFVNSSIATNTAYFIGTFASVADLEAYSGTVTNNDYAFVTSTDSAGNTLYNRYKYNAATQTWSFEYAVNNTAFTAAQWAAIQSGLTASDKTKLDGIEQGANKTVIDASPTSGSSNAVSSGGVYTALSGKQDTISDLSDIRSGASAGSTAVQPSALTDYQTKLSGTNKLDPAYIEYDASHRAVSDAEKSTWNGKQDAISDLSTIRSGAAAGATALQQSDVTSTYSASGTAPVNGTAVNAAIGTLDVSSVGGTGKVISAISETDGKISATATTMDTTPTANSQNPVTSGGVAASQAVQDAKIAWNANQGVKNLASINITSGTYIGFTVTATRETVTVESGTTAPSPTANFRILTPFIALKAGTYEITGCPATGTDSTYRLDVRYTGSSGTDVIAADYGTGKSFTLAQDSTVGIYMRFERGYTITTPITFKPMLCLKSLYDSDNSYQPYALPNPVITPALIEQVDGGAKNFVQLGFTSTSGSSSVPATTNNNDGTITVNGSRVGGATILVQDLITAKTSSVNTRYTLPAGNYVIAPTGNVNIGLQVYKHDGTTLVSLGNARSEALSFTYSDTDKVQYPYICIRLFCEGNATINNLTFMPMVCSKAAWDASHKCVPYRPSLQEMWEMIQTMQSGGASTQSVQPTLMSEANPR